MNKRRFLYFSLIAAFAIILVAGTALAADDGPLFHRNISRTPDTMTGASQMSVMHLYVPAQNTQGEAVSVEYEGADSVVYTRAKAKPLFATYNDGIEPEADIEVGIMTGTGFGDRDVFAALSLDDGETWKNYNLSDSADKSSFVLKDGHDYPGDVFRVEHEVIDNRVAVAWISRFCESGSPLYSWSEEEQIELAYLGTEEVEPLLGTEVEIDEITFNTYTSDLFGVAGNQKSVDYTLQGFPEVGEIPYGCVWVARGTLEEVDADTGALSPGSGVYDIVWRAAERLTSGRRDANRVDITGVSGAGFIISWQEDPDGLRPGKGLGPGEGWSGAIANSKTDIWYSYIPWDLFDDVCTADTDDLNVCTGGSLLDADPDSKPKVAVPFAVPMRLTDNNMCKPGLTDLNPGYLPYCNADFDESGILDYCADEVTFYNGADQPVTACVAEDGRLLTGRTASTRVRWAIKPYTKADGTVSAWVVMAEEKMKALGTTLEEGCMVTEDEDCIFDIGKNMWYHTFEFNNPELVQQGLMLNSPALDPSYPDERVVLDSNTDEITYDISGETFEYKVYDTEIARRFNLMVNSPTAMQAEGTSGTAAILIYKEGILNQGGPADIFIRRVVLPEEFDPEVDNPFDYENIVCDAFDNPTVSGDENAVNPTEDGTILPDWLFKPDPVTGECPDEGCNPNYVRGLCTVQGINVSGTTIIACDGVDGDCADQFPFSADYEEWYQGDVPITLPKVTEWRQCGLEADGITLTDIVGCEEGSNLDDPSWENPYDVSKGHRGFIDGDFVMLMYATAPNWNANTVGNEAYNLYIRRSFDGGQTWTTLPSNYVHWDDTNLENLGILPDAIITYEDYGWGGQTEVATPFEYQPGDYEQARNVSRLTGSKITVLDPRYSPTGGGLKLDVTNLLCYGDADGDDTTVGDDWVNCGYTKDVAVDENGEDLYYPEDIRNPSIFFATFETGDNTVVDVETGANPLDMYYSRATYFGDLWDEQDACLKDWYPSANCDDGDVDNRWDWLENGDEWATEASVYGNPSGDRFYAVWNQELAVDVDAEIFTDMDSEFRRIFYNDTADGLAAAEIVYVSSVFLDIADDDKVNFKGWARDYDHLGDGAQIINYLWFDDKGAILCSQDLKLEDKFEDECSKDKEGNCKCDDVIGVEWDSEIGIWKITQGPDFICDKDQALDFECTNEAEAMAGELGAGKRDINFQAMDNEGHWSRTDTVNVYVFEHLFQSFLPVIP